MIWLRKQYRWEFRPNGGWSMDPRPSTRGDVTDLRRFRYEFSSLRALFKRYRRDVALKIEKFPISPHQWMKKPSLRMQVRHGIGVNDLGLIQVWIDGHDLMDWLARNVKGKCRVNIIHDMTTSFGVPRDYKYAVIDLTDERDEAALRMVFDIPENIF